MLVRTGSDVEKRSFTTVGISHQSHIYGAAFAEGQLLQLIFAPDACFSPQPPRGNRAAQPAPLASCSLIISIIYSLPADEREISYPITLYLIGSRSGAFSKTSTVLPLINPISTIRLRKPPVSQHFYDYTFFTGIQFGQTHSLSAFLFYFGGKDNTYVRKAQINLECF